MRVFLLAASVLAWVYPAGCGGPSLTTLGALVKFTDAEALDIDCKPIRDVMARGRDTEEVEIYIRNEAGSMAADRVVVQERTEIPDGVVIKAQAYGCPSGG